MHQGVGGTVGEPIEVEEPVAAGARNTVGTIEDCVPLIETIAGVIGRRTRRAHGDRDIARPHPVGTAHPLVVGLADRQSPEVGLVGPGEAAARTVAGTQECLDRSRHGCRIGIEGSVVGNVAGRVEVLLFNVGENPRQPTPVGAGAVEGGPRTVHRERIVAVAALARCLARTILASTSASGLSCSANLFSSRA
jgi:hypothetical protein